MHLKKQLEIVATRALPKQISRDPLLQSMMAQNLIIKGSHPISIMKDPPAVVDLIAVAECVVEAFMAVAASAVLAEPSPSVEALEAGEAAVASAAATKHST